LIKRGVRMAKKGKSGAGVEGASKLSGKIPQRTLPQPREKGGGRSSVRATSRQRTEGGELGRERQGKEGRRKKDKVMSKKKK